MGPPAPFGLYRPQAERDACGAGFIANLRGEKSHDLIHHALEILVNLTHRGACGCDEKTGDGAGVLIQMPHAFLVKVASGEGIPLPHEGEYGAGLVFLPPDQTQREFCMDRFEEVIAHEGQRFLGWRTIPVDHDIIGDVARRAEPCICQVFIGRGAGMDDERDFERKLYVIRRVIENEIHGSDLTERSFFYLPSLSCRTLVYKGLLLADQVEPFFHADLKDEDMISGLALVHQRYSTNTFPTWDLAQPFRFLCHNGEINTLRGNANLMRARQGLFESPLFGDDIRKLFPVLTPGASDSANLDNALELLYHTGRSLPHCMMMMIPEAWQNHRSMSDERKAFYEYHAALMEPWDGPASIPFTDGRCIGAVLDRNGLRPSRYTVTKDGMVIMSSETGVVEVDPANVEYKGRLMPGRIFLVDMEEGRIVDDEEIKSEMAGRRPYRAWLTDNQVTFAHLPPPPPPPEKRDADDLLRYQKVHGYTREDRKILLTPMARDAYEAMGSMGDDTPMAVLSQRVRLLYSYFRQLFAQVTNPPLDAIREELVTSLITTLGEEEDLLDETPGHCRQFRLDQPILTDAQLRQLVHIDMHGMKARVLPMVYPATSGGDGLRRALDALCDAASRAIDEGVAILVLSDRSVDEVHAPIPTLLATGAVHHHLVREMKRTRCGIVLETGEAREVHHMCVLFAYGACAVNPYLAYETLEQMIEERTLVDIDIDTAVANYIKALDKGILKVMSKMGISTLHSYRCAQIFEAIGLHQDLVDRYFTDTASRIGGIDLYTVAKEVRLRHEHGFDVHIAEFRGLNSGGKYQWRRRGEYHAYNPLTVAKLQHACRTNDEKVYREFADLLNTNNRHVGALRGLLRIKRDEGKAIPIEEVEPWEDIVTRFKTGAMSYGSISQEAHETLAIAMNRIGGRSNSGEGGEDEDRFHPDANGDKRNSAIKQVASGRFGVTSYYLSQADELQIKMAQGAKPGEGGQLPGFKVYPWIAKTRHSTPYVGLISPPPHHDIYSIEDIAQLIHDLKNANPEARVNVKLVAEFGVGIVAAGIAKGKADVVLISGHDGGTGSSPLTSIKYAGLPWELGLSETQQTLVANGLRDRIVVECDGQLKTGRDVAIACLLGAEEFGFSSAPLVVMGCIMMRVCHLNTCPVGIATQDPQLRKKFTGTPEHVINFFRFVAQEFREIMAALGYRTVDEMVGRTECLDVRDAVDHWKAEGLDLTPILARAEPLDPADTLYCSKPQDHGMAEALDHRLIELAAPALESGTPVEHEIRIRNTNRTVGTMLSHAVSKTHGAAGLPDHTIHFRCLGSCGQSFAAFGAPGLTFTIEGDANDYFGKGLSGARLIIRPPRASTFPAEENILIGNVAFYGAIRGEAYIRGIAGERFCVRNSGVHAVVEGVGDHGCEYMTGGRAVILGTTGRNFASGMSGGIAYVLDETADFADLRCNRDMVDLDPVETEEDINELKQLIENHVAYTDSAVGRRILRRWDATLPKFVKVMPVDYKKALARLAGDEPDTEVGIEAFEVVG